MCSSSFDTVLSQGWKPLVYMNFLGMLRPSYLSSSFLEADFLTIALGRITKY